MLGIGVVEGFFGPEWSWESRQKFCASIPDYGGRYYIYAPKRDPFLRKQWTSDHPAETWAELRRLSRICHERKLCFGVGLSPFEIHTHWDATARRRLSDKVKVLEDLGLDYLGLFFDDMKGAPDLAEKQIEIVDCVRAATKRTLLFCPTYYSDDPILDKVFGAREPDYLETIGSGIASDVQILWTGNKVISKTISAEELEQVARILRRKPLIWDNYFANDGPKQCKFLRLKSLRGRDQQAYEASAGWAFNLMNQPGLSEILFAASAKVLLEGQQPTPAFEAAVREIAGPELATAILESEMLFDEVGIDKMDEGARSALRQKLEKGGRFGREAIDWLDGKYVVGAECLTD